MIGNRRGSISESYAAVIAIAFGLMAIALGIYVGYELNGYASIQLVRSDIWGAIIAYETGGKTVIVVENIGRQAFFVNKSFIDGKVVPVTEGERGYLERGEYNGPGLGPDQYEELYASAAGTIAQAQLCATSYPKACVVIWTYINYTVRNRSQTELAGPSAVGPNEAEVLIEDPYGAQWSLTWMGSAAGIMSGNSSRTVAITLPTSASSITASLSTERPYYSVPTSQVIGAGQSGTFIIDYNATGTAIIDDAVDAAWSLAWTGYSDGGYSSSSSAVVPIEAGTGVAVSLTARYDGGNCSSTPPSGKLEAGGAILFQVNCTGAPHYNIYYNATSPSSGYSLSFFTVLKPIVVDAWINRIIPLRSGWNSGELAGGDVGVEVQVGPLYLESAVPVQDIASWALPNLTYVVDWNGTIYGEAGSWGRSQYVGGSYVTPITFQSPSLPTTYLSRGDYLLVLLGWLDVNGKPIGKPSASGWPYQANITAWFGEGAVGEPITASSSIASRTWTGQYVDTPYPELIPLRGEADEVTLSVPRGYQVYWSNSEGVVGSPIQNPILVRNGSTIYVFVGKPQSNGSGSGSNDILYFTVSDPPGAGWAVSSPAQSISGNATTALEQTLNLGSNLPVTVTAGITSNPSGENCSIAPSSTTVTQDYDSLSFAVSCTSSSGGGGGSGGGASGEISVAVTDPSGAGWSLSWSGGASGGKTGSSTATFTVSDSGPVSFTASITSDPPGEVATISPATATAPANASITFTVATQGKRIGCLLTLDVGINDTSGGSVSGTPSVPVFVAEGGIEDWSASTTPNPGYGFLGWLLSLSGAGSYANTPLAKPEISGSYSCPSGLNENETAVLAATARYVKDYAEIAGPSTVSQTGSYVFTLRWDEAPQSAEYVAWGTNGTASGNTLYIYAYLTITQYGGWTTLEIPWAVTLGDVTCPPKWVPYIQSSFSTGDIPASGETGNITQQIPITVGCQPPSKI